jgi:hypothetical protein
MADDYEQTTGHQLHCTAGFSDLCRCDDEWITAREYLHRTADLMIPFLRIMTIHNTRRTVTVATRKYKARRRR